MLRLLLPVLFPSWRFFSSIGPSPRIYIAFLDKVDQIPTEWIEFRPLPEFISVKKGLWRLVHNPQWNETLFVNTCAEHLFEAHSRMREQEIMWRILRAIHSGEINHTAEAKFVTYRICALIREGATVTQTTTFIARPAMITVALGKSNGGSC